jgi:hypothetical protein
VKPPAKKENLFLNLICNIAIPTFVLMKLSGENRLGPQWGMIIALIFPLGYGVADLVRRKKTNLLSVLGIVSVLLTGTLNQMKADGFWFAVKDAAIPTVIGIAVLVSLRTKTPLVRELFYNDQIIDVARIDTALAARGEQAAFNRLLFKASLWLALAFLVSAALNFSLARYLLKSPPGTPAFNAELGRMHVLSWPVIVVPSMIVMMLMLWRLLGGLQKLTGLKMDELFHPEPEKKSPASKP